MTSIARASGPTNGRRTLVLCEPPFLFWDRSMDRLREGEETILGMGVRVLAAIARQRGYRVHLSGDYDDLTFEERRIA